MLLFKFFHQRSTLLIVLHSFLNFEMHTCLALTCLRPALPTMSLQTRPALPTMSLQHLPQTRLHFVLKKDTHSVALVGALFS